MKGFKAFNSDLTCREFQYKIGEIYTLEDPSSLKICERGFHFCPDIVSCYGYYPAKEATRICEVEALGEIQKSINDNKMATNKIKIVREITGPEKRGNLTEQNGYCNTGESNTGNWNAGNYNTGSRNTGNCNDGNMNTGYCNAGHGNTGEYNDGDYNIGDWNTGDWNVGSYNTGDYNSGNNNFGNNNTGDRNYGDWNTGEHNSGSCNSGSYNSGNWNAGCFNTNLNPKISMFNEPSDWTMVKWKSSESRYVMLHLMSTQEDKQSRWDELNEKDKATVMSLPNFDADIFYECTGIRVE